MFSETFEQLSKKKIHNLPLRPHHVLLGVIVKLPKVFLLTITTDSARQEFSTYFCA